MNILEYKIGYKGAFFGCINREVEISWDTNSTKECCIYWIDHENNRLFLGTKPGRYSLPLLKKQIKALNRCFDSLAGTIQFRFEPKDPKKGVFFKTPRFHKCTLETKWIPSDSTKGWFIFDKGQVASWEDPRWNQGNIDALQPKEWFSEVLGMNSLLLSNENHFIWMQKEQPFCVEISDVYGISPLGWFSNNDQLESWSYSSNETRFMATLGESLSITPPPLNKEHFGRWKINSFLSSKTYIDYFKGTKNYFQAYCLYGFVILNEIESLKGWCPWFLEDWLGRRFKVITKENKIHFFRYEKNKEWKVLNKTKISYDESCIVEDHKGNFWSLVASEGQNIYESVSYDGCQSWENYKMILKGGQFPLLVMSQKGKRIRAVIKDHKLLFSVGGSLHWWSASSSEGELRVKEDRFSIIASKDLKESWYMLICLESEEGPSEWVSFDECKTWSRLNIK